MLSNPSAADGLSADLTAVLRGALEASVVSDGSDASVQNQVRKQWLWWIHYF